jgi:class 3 adenylate cyclase
MEVLFLGWIYYLMDRWHDREDRRARTSEQLGRANDVISRYVASQLAQQIRAGNYEAVDRHDRRRLTLFFSDIEDFATTADHVEPEDLSEVLNEYLSEMARIAERYGGTIDEFVGDAVMIFFGAPQSTSDRDQALRAVRMAIEMQATISELRERWAGAGYEFTFHVRMGISTGQASIGNFGSEKARRLHRDRPPGEPRRPPSGAVRPRSGPPKLEVAHEDADHPPGGGRRRWLVGPSLGRRLISRVPLTPVPNASQRSLTAATKPFRFVDERTLRPAPNERVPRTH